MKRYYIDTLNKKHYYYSGQELLKGLRTRNLVNKYKLGQVTLYFIAEDNRHHEIEILTNADTRIKKSIKCDNLRVIKMTGIRYNGEVERWPTPEGKKCSFWSLFGMSNGKEVHIIDLDNEARMKAILNFLQ